MCSVCTWGKIFKIVLFFFYSIYFYFISIYVYVSLNWFSKDDDIDKWHRKLSESNISLGDDF